MTTLSDPSDPARRSIDTDTATHGDTAADADVARVRAGVAAFDFDGTLSRRDTLVPFLRQVCGTGRVVRTMARAALRTRDRDEIKLAMIDVLFRGRPAEHVSSLGERYAAALPELFRPEMLERLRWHQEAGHAVVFVSASLGVYLRPLARELGLDDVLAVELTADGDGLLTGEVVGGSNTRGPAKASRLLAWTAQRFGHDTEIEVWAYGDSAGDIELLELADHPTWVGRRANGPKAR